MTTKSAPRFGTRSLQRAIRIACSCALALGSITAIAAAQTSARPIRTIRAGHASAPAFRENILMAVSACQVVKGLPQVPPELPGNAQLESLDIGRIEELFDGTRYARYVTGASIWADPTAGCVPRQIRHYSVNIELGCSSRIYGGTTLIGELVDLNNPRPPDITLREEAVRSTQCDRPPRPYDPTGLPTDDASGTPCVWLSDFMKRSMAAAGLPVGPDAGEGFDTCLYARQPSLNAGRGRHVVVLRTRASNLSANGTWIPGILGEAQASIQSLVSISDGQPIPAVRFTIEGARSFLSQPVKLGMTERQ